MNVAIIGGGAAGMATAYLLNKQHDVTVFEKKPILGGNIRTLNKNVKNLSIHGDLVIDNGVIEFERYYFPTFHKLMRSLNVTVEDVHLSSELFLAEGRYFKSGAGIVVGCNRLAERLREINKLFPVMGGYFLFLFRAYLSTLRSLRNKPVSTYLSHGISAAWLKMLLMYAYSIPYPKIRDFPAEIAIPLLRHSGMFTKWDRIVGGVYTYIEKIVECFNGKIHCDAHISSVKRGIDGISIVMGNGDTLRFDKVVLAVTPDQVLNVLADPSEQENRRFSSWEANEIETVIHTDVSFYKHFGVTYYSEFDLFQNDRIGNCGYNAHLNRLCGIDSEKFGHYSLAYNLDKRIDPDKIVHVQKHHTPLYSVEAVRYRHEVISTNGENHTYHAGAYLGDGLHEGAICSAYRVAELFFNQK